MATVCLAHDLEHDRKVAVSVLHPELVAVIGAQRDQDHGESAAS
jgi:serine/threonine-protein kinase